MRLNFLLLITAAALAAAACSSAGKIQNDDFTNTGFIAQNCFQVIVSASPESGTYGLVNQRESSYFAAKQKIPGKIHLAMAEYIINREIADSPSGPPDGFNRQKTIMALEIDINRYKKNGYIAAEYYSEDNSVTLAYRIVDSGIKRRLNSTAIELISD